MELDATWADNVEKWCHELHQTKKILIPVISNQLLTLAGWYYVYNCETDPNSLAYYLLDSRHEFSTGSDLYDGALNGVICVSLLAAMSFFMLMVALYNFRRLIKAWLSISCLLIVFGISALFLRDAFEVAGVTDNIWVWTLLGGGLYGAGGVAVFFSTKLPLWLHQLYVVTNCSLVSLYYLRMLPAHTTWFLLGAIILWDAFAVLAPQGPLNLITGCAENYSDNILRFLMFTAEIQPISVSTLDKSPTMKSNDAEIVDENIIISSNAVSDYQDDEDSDSCSTAENITEEFEKLIASQTRERTAKDALDDDNSIRLGLGDFVFYSVLVGKAASSGSLPATIAAIIGVVLGLIITLTVFSDTDETMPALPCSVALGMIFHFGTLYGIEHAYHLLSDQLFLLLSEG